MRLVALLMVLAWGLAALAQDLELVTPKKSQKLSLSDLKTKLKTYTIKIDDPVYEKPKVFDAFFMPELLQLAGVGPADRADELVFTAVDGYAPNTTFNKLKEHKAYLAYQEHDTPGRFGMVIQGKASISPWPFYLIWEEGAKLKDQVPWPYQLVKIEVVDWNAKFPQVVPLKAKSDSAEIKGFALFKDQCIRCHSINLQGGEIGPELNVPQNVTEYWKKDVLKSFIKNVSRFRAKSKMPNFDQLSENDIDHVYSYLRAMKDYKIRLP